MKAGNILRVLAGVAVFVLLATLVANRNNLSIRYHVMMLQDARRPIGPMSGPKVNYALHWVRWLVQGRPDRATQQASAWKHEEALINLGYCERRAYALTNGTMIDVTKTFVGHRFKDGLFSMGAAGGMDRFVVFATTEDFPFLEEKIKEVESESKRETDQR